MQNRVHEWISESLYVYGFISHEHLTRKFASSKLQACRMLLDFEKARPGIMRYNAEARRYERSYEPRRYTQMKQEVSDAKKKANQRKNAKRKEAKAARSRLGSSAVPAWQRPSEDNQRALQ